MNSGEIAEMPAYLAKFYTELKVCSGCIHQMYSFWQGNHVSSVPEGLDFQVIFFYDGNSPVPAQQ